MSLVTVLLLSIGIGLWVGNLVGRKVMSYVIKRRAPPPGVRGWFIVAPSTIWLFLLVIDGSAAICLNAALERTRPAVLGGGSTFLASFALPWWLIAFVGALPIGHLVGVLSACVRGRDAGDRLTSKSVR